MQRECFCNVHENMTSREYYLNIALKKVKLVENELAAYFNSLDSTTYGIVSSSLDGTKNATFIRRIIGQTAYPPFMQDFDHVIQPRLTEAVRRWKKHCVQFGTDSLVNERTVLEQWTEETIQHIAFVAMTSLSAENLRSNSTETYIRHKFVTTFPFVDRWQREHSR